LGYEVSIVPSAEKEMNRLPATVHTRISKRILTLADNPRPRGFRKLSGRDEYRLRVGDYRILYIVDDGIRSVTVLAVGHRREVYG
jgi:mRNA interferase RelE/StbE